MDRDRDPLLESFDAVLRSRDAAAHAQRDFRGFLTQYGVSGGDLNAMLEVGPARFLVYRRLIHRRMRRTITDFITRAADQLGDTRFDSDVEHWLDEQGPRSPYLRDIPREFVTWAEPRWHDDPSVPPHIADLARHELLEYDVRNDPAGGEPPTGHAVALDRALRFDGTLQVMRYEFAVHRLPNDPSQRVAPLHRPTTLAIYRDKLGKPRYLELTEFAANLLDALLSGVALEAALRTTCATPTGALPEDRLASAATLLADLAERGALLGASS